MDWHIKIMIYFLGKQCQFHLHAVKVKSSEYYVKKGFVVKYLYTHAFAVESRYALTNIFLDKHQG